jgi:carbon storage regulator
MLTLIRKKGQEIYIDKGQIKITVLFEREGVIGIGIRAPKHIDIERKEVFIRKQIEQHEQKKNAISTSEDAS